MSSMIKNFLSHCRSQIWSLSVLFFLLFFLSVPQTSHLVTRVRNASYDLYQRLYPRLYQPAPVRIAAIDNQSLEKIGQFPWSRLKTAELVNKLNALGAKVIVFDMLFSEPDRTSPQQLKQFYPQLSEQLNALPDNDAVLAIAIEKANVVTSFMLTQNKDKTRLPTPKAGLMILTTPPFAAMNCQHPYAATSLEKIEQAAKGNGTVAYFADEDGVIRNVPLFLCLQDSLSATGYRLTPTIGLEAVRLFSQQQQYKVYTEEDASVFQIDVGNQLSLFPNSMANIWLHYTPERASRYLPVWKILADEIDPKEIEGKIIFIGVTASNLFDMRFNPFGRVIPGVEVHAQLAEQLLQSSYLSELIGESVWVRLLWICIAYCFYRWYQKLSALKLALVLISFVSLIILFSCWAFTHWRLLTDPLIPSVGCLLLFGSFFIQKQLQTESEKKWLRTAFGRYISPNRVKFLIDHPDSLTLGGEYRECSFVMTDLAGFTTLMEKHPPHECVSMLNHYLDGMIEIAFKYQGTLDRIVGDAVAVIFSAPIEQHNHRELALKCALEMDEYGMRFVHEKSEEGIKFGITRIGVCTGKVLIGNFGGKTMFDYRALGDPINTASRLESVNKQFGTRLCVAESTLAPHQDQFKARPIGKLVLKGKTEAIQAFELLTDEQFNSPLIQAYLNAYQKLEAKAEDCCEIFTQLRQQYPDDALSYYHCRRLEDQQTGSTIVLKDK